MARRAIKVLLVSSEKEALNEISDLLSQVEDVEIVGAAASMDQGLYKIKEADAEVIIVDDVLTEAYDFISRANAQFFDRAFLLLGSPPVEDCYRRAMLAGAKDVLVKPFDPLTLTDAIYKSYDFVKQRRLALPPTEASREVESKPAKVITVFSTKGGVGKSTTSVNLATALAMAVGRNRVVLWDLDLHCGVVALATNIVPRRHITDLVNEIQYLDEELIESYLEPHPSGLQVLAAPFSPEFADYISGDHVSKILNVLQETKDYIVVDTSSYFHEPVMAAMENSDRILLVGSLDLATIKNLKAALMVMENLHYPRSKLRVVINRATREFGVSLQDVETTLKLPVFAGIPSEGKIAMTALNNGTPVVYAYPKTEMARAYQVLADKLLKGEEPQDGETAKKSRVSFFGFGKKA